MELKIVIHDNGTRSLMNRMVAFASPAVQNKALSEAGQAIVADTKRRFLSGIAPDGSRWKPLKPATIRQKIKKYGVANAHKPLIGSGAMMNGIDFSVENGRLYVGSNKSYAKYHQFGTRSIPARPMIGGQARIGSLALTAIKMLFNKIVGK